jgi:hypothetical protein
MKVNCRLIEIKGRVASYKGIDIIGGTIEVMEGRRTTIFRDRVKTKKPPAN